MALSHLPPCSIVSPGSFCFLQDKSPFQNPTEAGTQQPAPAPPLALLSVTPTPGLDLFIISGHPGATRASLCGARAELLWPYCPSHLQIKVYLLPRPEKPKCHYLPAAPQMRFLRVLSAVVKFIAIIRNAVNITDSRELQITKL